MKYQFYRNKLLSGWLLTFSLTNVDIILEKPNSLIIINPQEWFKLSILNFSSINHIGKPISKSQLLAYLEEAKKQIEKGFYFTIDDLGKESENMVMRKKKVIFSS